MIAASTPDSAVPIDIYIPWKPRSVLRQPPAAIRAPRSTASNPSPTTHDPLPATRNWEAIRAALVRALDPFPDARAAVLVALDALNAGEEHHG